MPLINYPAREPTLFDLLGNPVTLSSPTFLSAHNWWGFNHGSAVVTTSSISTSWSISVWLYPIDLFSAVLMTKPVNLAVTQAQQLTLQGRVAQ